MLARYSPDGNTGTGNGPDELRMPRLGSGFFVIPAFIGVDADKGFIYSWIPGMFCALTCAPA